LTPWFAVDASRWPRMLARLRELGPLEDDDARADLRYLENEHRIFLLGKGGGSQFPGRTELMKRWGWEDRAVRKLLAAEDWQDPNRPVAKEQLRQSFKGARKGEADACPMTRQWSANEPPMTAPANADNQPIASNERPMAVQSMSIARASSEPRSTTEPRTQEAAPAAPSEPTPKARTSDEDTLYAAYRGFRPRIPPTPTPDTRKHLRRILTEAGGIEPAGLYLAWTFQSQDERALQVQGKAPWPGGRLNAMLSLEELGRHVGSRMPMAEAWDARGRRSGPQAPPGQAPRTPRGTLASDLFRDDPEPDPKPRANALDANWSEA
jgi:hypothetical protein